MMGAGARLKYENDSTRGVDPRSHKQRVLEESAQQRDCFSISQGLLLGSGGRLATAKPSPGPDLFGSRWEKCGDRAKMQSLGLWKI
jgi:hypothetical protein